LTAQSIKAFYEAQIEAFKEANRQFEIEIDGMNQTAAAMVVDSPESERAAINLGSELKRLTKAIESARLEAVKAPKNYAAALDATAKFYSQKARDGQLQIDKKLSDYRVAKELEVRRKVEEERKARAELQARLDAEAARLNAEAKARDAAAPEVAAPQIPDAVAPPEEKTVRSDAGKVTFVKTWDFEIIDPAAVPRDYLAVDEKAVRKAVKDGLREIPGVRVFEKTSTRY
jgi:hypothetical protein